MEAIGAACEGKDDCALAAELSKLSSTGIPKAGEEIRTAPVLHDTVVEVPQMKEAVKKFLGM